MQLLEELNVYAPEEYQSLVTLCKLSGEEGRSLLRGARKNGEQLSKHSLRTGKLSLLRQGFLEWDIHPKGLKRVY